MIKVLEFMQAVGRRIRAQAHADPRYGVRGEEERPTGSDLGFMEYFDWLAGCKDWELIKLGETYEVPFIPAHVNPLSPTQRNDLGVLIWARM